MEPDELLNLKSIDGLKAEQKKAAPKDTKKTEAKAAAKEGKK